MLAVVEHDQQVAGAQMVDHRRCGRTVPAPHAECGGRGVTDERAIVEQRQVDPHDPVAERLERSARSFGGEAGLAAPAGAHHGHDPAHRQQGQQVVEQRLLADELAAVARDQRRRRVDGAQRRELGGQAGGAQLADAHRLLDAAQAVHPEIGHLRARFEIPGELDRRHRHHHLAAVGRAEQPPAAVQRRTGESAVGVLPDLARVHRRPDPNRLGRRPGFVEHPTLQVDGRGQRVAGRGEHQHRAVARALLDRTPAAVRVGDRVRERHEPGHRLAHRLGLVLPRRRRVLDVGEHERPHADRTTGAAPRRTCCHGAHLDRTGRRYVPHLGEVGGPASSDDGARRRPTRRTDDQEGRQWPTTPR
ncbi:MAG: hypothetical protein R2699_10315 [Acidimicrobiales bacterium]